MTKNGLAVSIATIWMRQTMPQSAMDEWSVARMLNLWINAGFITSKK
jgi:hypothetical protein